jgi:hypothetical protein
MPTLSSAEPPIEERIKATSRKSREQKAQYDPEMRIFVRRAPLWLRLFAKLLFYKLMVQRKLQNS